MGRNEKDYTTPEEYIQRRYLRGLNQELAGQTKLKHYKANKHKMHHCDMCDTDIKAARHRIIPNTKYTDENVFYSCRKCHGLIHRMINQCKPRNRKEFIVVLMLTKAEVRQRNGAEETHS